MKYLLMLLVACGEKEIVDTADPASDVEIYIIEQECDDVEYLVSTETVTEIMEIPWEARDVHCRRDTDPDGEPWYEYTPMATYKNETQQFVYRYDCTPYYSNTQPQMVSYWLEECY